MNNNSPTSKVTKVGTSLSSPSSLYSSSMGLNIFHFYNGIKAIYLKMHKTIKLKIFLPSQPLRWLTSNSFSLVKSLNLWGRDFNMIVSGQVFSKGGFERTSYREVASQLWLQAYTLLAILGDNHLMNLTILSPSCLFNLTLTWNYSNSLIYYLTLRFSWLRGAIFK